MSDFIDGALNNPDWKIRSEAVCKITDENALKDIFRNDSIVMVKISAMRRIGDIEFLCDECMNNPQGHLRMAILSRILDENLLEEDNLNPLLVHLTLNDPENSVCLAACENLSGNYQDVFINVAKSNGDKKLRCGAISKITDEDILSDFALNDENRFIRLEAIRNPNLANVNVVARIIENDEDEFNRALAIMKIPDCEALLEIISDDSLYLRLGEIAKSISFSAENCAISVLKDDCDSYRRIAAVNFIKSPEILEGIVLNSDEDMLVAEAIKNSNFKNQDILEGLIKNESNECIVFETIDKIDDENILIDYVKSHLAPNALTVKAISGITDLEFLDELYANPEFHFYAAKRMIELGYNLESIARDSPSREIRFEEVRAMSDKYVLAQIASESQDRDIIMAALDRIAPEKLINAYLPRGFSSIRDIEFKSRIWSLATESGDTEIQKSAISKLNEKEVLDEIISSNMDIGLVNVAQSRLDTLFDDIRLINDEEVLNAIAQRGDEDIKSAVSAQIEDLKTWRDRIAEISEMSDVNLLKDIANNDYNYFVRCEAEGKLENLLFNVRLDEMELSENQDKFRKIANDETYPLEIRKKAVLKIMK